MTKIQIEAAKACFESNPKINEVSVTSDGNCFTSNNLLENHVREARLNKADTVIITREDVEGEAKKAEEKAAAPKPFSKMNKLELLDAAAQLNIQVPEGATNKEIAELLIKASEAEGEKGGETNV